MSDHVETCAWKDVPSDEFVMGMPAQRCGEVAGVKLLRPHRKTDLFLCDHHLNAFIKKWGLHYEIEILEIGEEVIDPPAVIPVADPNLIIDRIASGCKVPKKKGNR